MASDIQQRALDVRSKLGMHLPLSYLGVFHEANPSLPVTQLLLIGLALGLSACSDPSSETEQIPLAVESQDNIVSENGQLTLGAGTLSILSVSLIGANRTSRCSDRSPSISRSLGRS